MKIYCLLAVLALLPLSSHAQEIPRMAKNAHPVYEVASIKPAVPEDQSSGFSTNGRRILVRNMPVRSMLMFAFGVQKDQLVNLPDWATSDRYYVDGYPDIDGRPNVEQFRGMVEKLLADRFGLKFHMEQRELPVYAIRVGKNGPKMKLNTTNPNGNPDETGNNNDNQQEWRFTNCTMNDTVNMLKFLLDRPVLNRTELEGRYDFTLKWTTAVGKALAADAPPDFFTAIQEQAGLKAEATRLPVDVMVIDKVERPSEN